MCRLWPLRRLLLNAETLRHQPSPATVANPPAPPIVLGTAIPPPLPPIKTESVVIDIVLMYRSHKKAFRVWTLIVALMSMLFASGLYNWLVFHIP